MEKKMGQKETAKQIWDYFITKSWSQESIAGMLGNMQSESGIIADRWQGDRVGNMSGGYGLVQWTPATKYINWAQSNGLRYQDVISQCKRIEWEVANNQQWMHPTMTFKQFTQLKSSPEQCALLFITHYERPANPNQPARQTQARHWYNQFHMSIDLSQYYTTNPGKIALLTSDNIYKSVEFNESTRGQLLAKNALVDVQGISHSAAGYPRLRISGGYLSANKSIVRKVVSTINDYYTTNLKKVILLKDDNCFNSVEFTEPNRSTLFKKNTLLDVIDTDYSKDGYPRLKLKDGRYLSANKSIVLKAVDNINDYYTSGIKEVVLLGEDCFYRDLDFTVRGEKISKNTIVPVSGVEFSSLGYPRLVTAKGYLTANKNLVRKVSENIANYITTKPDKVKLLIDDYFYTSVEFLPENRSNKVAVGTIVDVLDIDYASDGVPRLKTGQGYLTSNKSFVAVVN